MIRQLGLVNTGRQRRSDLTLLAVGTTIGVTQSGVTVRECLHDDRAARSQMPTQQILHRHLFTTSLKAIVLLLSS